MCDSAAYYVASAMMTSDLSDVASYGGTGVFVELSVDSGKCRACESFCELDCDAVRPYEVSAVSAVDEARTGY